MKNMRFAYIVPAVVAAFLSLAPGCPKKGGGGTTGTGTGTATSTASSECAGAYSCGSSDTPATLHLTVSGFTHCTCFNGTFTLTQSSSSVWSSSTITGCPGQTADAFFKYSEGTEFGIGITDSSSNPGSGDSDFACAKTVTCVPLQVSGGGAKLGNINAFCPGSTEDETMTWSISE